VDDFPLTEPSSNEDQDERGRSRRREFKRERTMSLEMEWSGRFRGGRARQGWQDRVTGREGFKRSVGKEENRSAKREEGKGREKSRREQHGGKNCGKRGVRAALRQIQNHLASRSSLNKRGRGTSKGVEGVGRREVLPPGTRVGLTIVRKKKGIWARSPSDLSRRFITTG